MAAAAAAAEARLLQDGWTQWAGLVWAWLVWAGLVWAGLVWAEFVWVEPDRQTQQAVLVVASEHSSLIISLS